ncbi:MAG: HEAT repeat domain-containing protein [Candidatus Heimdallarchaeota archaeon]|nr:HEAT repeat domain-containing protein [Candidatus Heimdallarchaeota archaeon]
MNIDLDTTFKKFKKSTDREKLTIILDLGNYSEKEGVKNFLLNTAKNDPFEKIRIQAILALNKNKSEEIVDKLAELYPFEKEHSVRLAIIESMSTYDSSKVEKILELTVEKDENNILRSMALKHLHDRKQYDKGKMISLLYSVLTNDSELFTKQMALSILLFYADEETLGKLSLIYKMERSNKMKLLIYSKLEEISNKFNKKLTIVPPVEPIKGDKRNNKRRRRIRIRKKNKDKEYLFF